MECELRVESFIIERSGCTIAAQPRDCKPSLGSIRDVRVCPPSPPLFCGARRALDFLFDLFHRLHHLFYLISSVSLPLALALGLLGLVSFLNGSFLVSLLPGDLDFLLFDPALLSLSLPPRVSPLSMVNGVCELFNTLRTHQCNNLVFPAPSPIVIDVIN